MTSKLVALLVLIGVPCSAVSVLSHEEMVDIAWESDLRGILLARFPGASEAQVKKAHSFAYGGSMIQDLGYYPLGNRTFTNLLHYVRSGDFVLFLLRDARDINEYAFALGALGHYAADTWGHTAINLSVPILYPKLKRKYGDWVTYENDHEAHLRTEFSFDVLEVAKHRYKSQQFHDFIGFDVSEDLLERAFQDTYGIPLDKLLHYDDLTLETFRFAVAKVVPEMTEVALATRTPEIANERGDAARKEFLYHLSRTDYEREFGNKYRRPGIFARILGLLIRVIPLGPARVLGYRNPTPKTEDSYFRSMDKAIDEYRQQLRQLRADHLEIANRNLDTGRLTRAGEYRLSDRAYAALLKELAKDEFRHVTPALRANLLAYFSGGMPTKGSIKPGEWKKAEAALLRLKELPRSGSTLSHP